MSAQILVLPIVRAEREDSDKSILLQVRLPSSEWGRLNKLAAEWNVTPQEAAEMIVSDQIDPRRRR